MMLEKGGSCGALGIKEGDSCQLLAERGGGGGNGVGRGRMGL